MYSRFLLWKVWKNPSFLPSGRDEPPYMGNHKGVSPKRGYRRKIRPFSTLILTLFKASGLVMGAGHQRRPETLLTGMDTSPADRIILAAAVLPQEEGPFPPPFFTPAHKLPCSGVSRLGRFGSEGLCSAHSFFASSNLSRIEGLFSVSTFARSISSPLRPLLITPSIIP